MDGLELGRREVAERAVKAALVPPFDPAHGRKLQFVDRPPGRFPLHHLGLEESDDAPANALS
jgi:hypothetical protein